MIIELNDKAWTPKYTLDKAINCIDAIEHIAIAMKYKDGTSQTMVSYMPGEVLALLCKRLDLRLEWELIDDEPDEEFP